MSSLSVYTYLEYKEFLKTWVANSSDKGVLSRFSEAAKCQRSYVSRVLNEEAHFQPDQLYAIAQYMKLTTDELNYLLLLLDLERSAQPEYKNFLIEKIKKIQIEKLSIQNLLNLEPAEKLSQESELQWYFLSPIIVKIHVATSIPELQTVENLSKRFKIDTEEITLILEKLEKMSFVEKSSNKWIWKSGHMNLDIHHPISINYNYIWSMNANADLALAKEESVHYTMIQSISKADYPILKEKILNSIVDFNKKALPSKPEELICFKVDFFKVN